MLSPRRPTRQFLRGSALAIALLFAGNGTTTAADTVPATTVAHILPGDRAIAQIESLDPANAGITFILAPVASDGVAPWAAPEPINICIACDNLA